MKTIDDEHLIEKLQPYATEFGLGKVLEATNIKSGLINISYNTRTSRGNFIIQRLSPIFNSNVINDYQAAGAYLRTNGLFVPVLINTVTNGPFVERDGVWRAFEYVPNDAPMQKTPQLANEAAKLLSKFHAVMANFDYTLTFKLDGFHDTNRYLQKLDSLFCDENHERKAMRVYEDYHFIKKHISQHHLPDAQSTIIHADPKIENFLFKDGKGIAVLDVDTMMHANPFIDIGDALRSWCWTKPFHFNPNIFCAAIVGYNEHASKEITYKNAANAMSLITLELAARFLNDYFEESYFAWNPKKYRTAAEHNLERCRENTQYYLNFREKL